MLGSVGGAVSRGGLMGLLSLFTVALSGLRGSGTSIGVGSAKLIEPLSADVAFAVVFPKENQKKNLGSEIKEGVLRIPTRDWAMRAS